MDGLFNFATPETLQQDFMQNRVLNTQQMAQLPLLNQVAAMGGSAGSMLGNVVGRAFGGRSPEEARLEQMQGMLGGANMNDPDSLMEVAQRIQSVNPAAAQELAQRAMTMRKTQVETQAKEADVAAKQTATRREEQLRDELANLPAEATDQDVEAVVRKYGNPDQIFKTLERKQTAEANRQARAELELEKAERAEAARQERMQFQQTMAMLASQQRAATSELQRERIQQQIDAQKEKQQEVADKKQMALDMSIRHANKVITDVAAAKELVGFGTTGIMGKASGIVPGTDAFNLNQRVLTLKANLGFDRLQQMRDASPTGGALGQVAVQELEALQASVGSLEIGQSQAELRNNLEKIDKHYKAWLAAVQGARGPEAQGTPVGTPTMRYNPATGKLEPI
jgi:hypothetical protein